MINCYFCKHRIYQQIFFVIVQLYAIDQSSESGSDFTSEICHSFIIVLSFLSFFVCALRNYDLRKNYSLLHLFIESQLVPERKHYLCHERASWIQDISFVCVCERELHGICTPYKTRLIETKEKDKEIYQPLCW